MNEAELMFRIDATNKGYLDEGGAGLRAYYRDHGMDYPFDVPQEVTGLDLERVVKKTGVSHSRPVRPWDE